MSPQLSDYRCWYNKHQEEVLADYFTLLRFPSISTDPAYAKDVHTCVDWLAQYLKNIGLTVEVWPTEHYPILFATLLEAGPDRPTLLIYNHYDVQPVDPLALWMTPPFEPDLREGCVFARGASDNKGQLFYTITAMRAYLTLAKEHRLNIKLFIEGEEECGSVGTVKVLKEKSQAMKADYCLVIDAGLPAADSPAVTLGVRGITTMEISIRNSHTDLHSGIFGGIVHNPNQAMVEALAGFWKNGVVAVPGFYDDVIGFSEEELSVLDTSFDQQGLQESFGIRVFRGESGYTLRESNWIRPVLEINGMWGGYNGKGFKTVIPSEAHVKLSCRLVPKQEPDVIAKRVVEHFQRSLPEGMEMAYEIHHGGVPIYSSSHSQIAEAAQEAYSEVFDKECKFIVSPASVPIVSDLVQASGAEMILIGTATDEDDIHAPNEHFNLGQFERGFLVVGRILSLLEAKKFEVL